MAEDLEAGRHFLVITTIFNRGFDSFSTDRLVSSFLITGEKKDITVLATIPFIYDHVSAIAVHPAYYGDGARSDKMPFALRTVMLPTLRPLSWRYLLDSGAPIREGDYGITPTTIQWTNPETGLLYTLYPKNRHGGKSGSGYSTVLTVDLNPFLRLENNQRYLKKSYAYFYRKAEGIWKLK